MNGHLHQVRYNSIVHKSISNAAQQLCIPVKGMLETVFNAMYDPVKTENSIKQPVEAFLHSIGVRSIQPTKDTTTLGKYLLTIQAEKEDNIPNKVHQMCENLKVDHPQLAQDCFAIFEH